MPADKINIDKVLLRQIADGDEKAFRILFYHYKDRFYSVVLKMSRSGDTAEEIVQEVFIKIWEQRASLIEINNPDAYFFTVIYRRVFDHYKKIALERKLLKVISEFPTFQNITDETVLANESERLVKEAVTKLPPQQQLIFKLSKHQGMSREQIAEQLHLSPNTVRNHMAEAIKFIRIYLSNAALSYSVLAWLLND